MDAEKGTEMEMVFLAAMLGGYAWFAYQPRQRMRFAVSENRLRQDAAYAVWANNMEQQQ
jgi:cbb3-type cytochrome oxidase subunit 3